MIESLGGPTWIWARETSSLSGMIRGTRRHWRLGYIHCGTTDMILHQLASFLDVSCPVVDAMWTRASLIVRFA